MSRATATADEFSLAPSPDGAGQSQELPDWAPDSASSTGGASGDLRSGREAARRIALQISDDEYKELMRRHREYVMKRFSGGLTKSEELDLRLLRWQLDRIEDARHGQRLDELEILADNYSRFAKDVSGILEQLDSLRKAPSRKK